MSGLKNIKPKEKKTFDILVNNGYRFVYDCSIEAVSAKAARAIFLKREKGSWKADSHIRARERKSYTMSGLKQYQEKVVASTGSDWINTIKELRTAIKKAKDIWIMPRFSNDSEDQVRISKIEALHLIKNYKPTDTGEDLRTYTGKLGRVSGTNLYLG